MTLTPLGDQAVLARFEREADALTFAAAVRAASLPGVLDVVPAYVSVAVFYDVERTRYGELAPQLDRAHAAADRLPPAVGPLHVIPCSYDFGADLQRVADHTGLSPADVVRIHSGAEYTVYAVGFCPGFPYLGYLPDALSGVPRLPSPRLRVEPGSVGLTGRQTGVYPLERPGGWNLVGRTPLDLVNVAEGYFPLRPGDRVRFRAIDRAEFEQLRGGRL
ncbi:MAG: 5-oxoprolinase subunit PxpB [Gemmataceae bacterium]